MAATRNPIRFAEPINCSCGSPRPFGESLCADCKDIEEQESFLDPDSRSVYGHPDDQPCLDGYGERF